MVDSARRKQKAESSARERSGVDLTLMMWERYGSEYRSLVATTAANRSPGLWYRAEDRGARFR